jgi:hypothetical protein
LLKLFAKIIVGLLEILTYTGVAANGLPTMKPEAADISIHSGKTAADSSIMQLAPWVQPRLAGARGIL